MTGPEDPTPVSGVTALKAAPVKSRSERFKTYAHGAALLLTACTGLVLGIVAKWQGSEAEQTAQTAQETGKEERSQLWSKLRDKVNEQSSVINKLKLRMIAMQARQEGKTAGKLQAELEELQRKYDLAMKRRRLPQQIPMATRPRPKPKPKAGDLIRKLPHTYKK